MSDPRSTGGRVRPPQTGAKRRLDLELVARGLAPSRASARADITGGSVTVDGLQVTKPAARVSGSQQVEIERDDQPYVSRAGAKLAAALDRFAVDPRGRRCLDAGASTGGFTDCLLRRGAASIVAVDVGTDQFDRRLSAHPRITVRERTDIRTVERRQIGGAVDLVVADVSFISLGKIVPTLAALVAPDGDVVALVKPQFEAGREVVGRGRGIVRDPEIWRRAVADVTATAAENGLTLRGATVSPITGASGNVEFMVWFQPADGCSVTDHADHHSLILAAIAEARSA